MLKAIFTLDYEIHGNGDGSPYDLMVEPTERMMVLFEKFGAKLTILADVAEILKFKEYKEQFGRDDYHYEAIAEQLRDAIRRGHDVQLHLHASYFNARHERGRWVQDWSEYDFAGLPPERLHEIVRMGKDYLEGLLKLVSAGYECIAFRAANWSMSPSRNAVRALIANGFKIDTSVFKYGRRNGLVNFDYSKVPSDLIPWNADTDDICAQSDNGKLMEFPIYSESRGLCAFFTPQRIYRAFVSRLHKFSKKEGSELSNRNAVGSEIHQGLKSHWMTSRHAWKADFNQCSGRQLVRALERAETRHVNTSTALPFVLIGHSKLFTRFNESSLRPFLAYIAENPDRFAFAKFGEFNPDDFATTVPKKQSQSCSLIQEPKSA